MKINHFFISLFLIFLSYNGLIFSQNVLIMTYSYNRPDFIEIQDKTFKKFLKDTYTFVVFNDAPQEEMANKITETCNRLNLPCVRIPQSIHNQPYLQRWPGEDYNHPSVRNSNVVQYSLNNLGFDHNGIVMMIDSDMFLVEDFCVQNFLNGFDIAGVPQSRGCFEYIWIGLVFLDMQTLPDKKTINFNCGKIDGVGVDAGGQTYHYLKNHPEVMVKRIDNHYYPSDFIISESTHENVKFLFSHDCHSFEFMIKNSFFHYRGGSNWNYQSPQYHEKRTATLNAFIDKCLAQKN